MLPYRWCPRVGAQCGKINCIADIGVYSGDLMPLARYVLVATTGTRTLL